MHPVLRQGKRRSRFQERQQRAAKQSDLLAGDHRVSSFRKR